MLAPSPRASALLRLAVCCSAMWLCGGALAAEPAPEEVSPARSSTDRQPLLTPAQKARQAAQQAEAAPSPSTGRPERGGPPRLDTGPGEPSAVDHAGRFSAFSAGEGGPHFLGIWIPLGGLMGLGLSEIRHFPTDEQRALGIAFGAGLIGTGAVLYQYAFPMSVGSAWLSLWGAIAGCTFGMGAVYGLGLDRAPTGSPPALLGLALVIGSGLVGGWVLPMLPGTEAITGPDATAIVLSTLWVEAVVLHLFSVLGRPNPFKLGVVGLAAPAVMLAFGRTFLSRYDVTWRDALLGIGAPLFLSLFALAAGSIVGPFAGGVAGMLTLTAATAVAALTHELWAGERELPTPLGITDVRWAPVIAPVVLDRRAIPTVGAAAIF